MRVLQKPDGGRRLWSSALLTQRHADAIPLGVQQASDLREVAIKAPVVLVHGAFHQKGVLGVEDASDAFLGALHEHAGLLGVHVVPHPLVCLVPRVLGGGVRRNRWRWGGRRQWLVWSYF